MSKSKKTSYPIKKKKRQPIPQYVLRAAFLDLRDIEITSTVQYTFYTGFLCSKSKTTSLATFSIQGIKEKYKNFSNSEFLREILKLPCGLDYTNIFYCQVTSTVLVYLSNSKPSYPR